MSSVARGISDFFNPRPSHGITGLLKNEGLHVPSVVTSVEGRDFHPDVVRLGLSQHRVLQSSPIARIGSYILGSLGPARNLHPVGPWFGTTSK